MPTMGVARGSGPELADDIAQPVALRRYAVFDLGPRILSARLFAQRHLGLDLAQQVSEMSSPMRSMDATAAL